MIQRRLLVVGVRPGSLGDRILLEAVNDDSDAFERISGAEHPDRATDIDHKCDVTDRKQVITMLEDVRPTDVVCTVGINLPDNDATKMVANLSRQLQVNAWGPIQLLAETLDLWQRSMLPPETGFNFCAISSNSAHIARSTSTGYCASKAALSMALRCQARYWARTGAFRIWGYEPGWIGGTTMSEEVAMRLPEGAAPHRIPTGRGVNKFKLARRIYNDVKGGDVSLNGCMIRIDGGEQ